MTQDNTTMTASEALNHLAFWSSNKRLGFLKNVSDIMEMKKKQYVEAVEADKRFSGHYLREQIIIFCCRSVIGNSWIESLESVLQDKVVRDSRKRRSYSGASVGDLLRNADQKAKHCFNKLSNNVYRPSPTGF